MVTSPRIHIAAVCAFVFALGLRGMSQGPSACVDPTKDPSGCQPSTFKLPTEQMPSARVNRDGKVDPTSSEQDARAGFALLEKQLHLTRNFERLHWIALVPSAKDPATGAWKDGDLDGTGDGRSLAISGNCIFAGHRSETSTIHQMNVLKIQADPQKNAPVVVGEITAPVLDRKRPRGPGLDDKEARSLLFKTSGGEDRQVLVRLVEDVLETYRIDPATCLPMAKVSTHEFAGGAHEFFLWHDPANVNRVLIFMSMTDAGIPEVDHPGLMVPDAYVLALTDEKTGDLLPNPAVVAGFSLPDVGGPPPNERPDATGLFADGWYADYSEMKNRRGEGGEYMNREGNHLHSLSVSDDGERVYVAGGSTGLYVLDSEGIAHHTDAALAAGTAGCNQRSTIISVNGAIDASKLPQIANDCLHMVVNDTPGLKAMLASNASPQAKAQRYLVMLTRSRFDVHPPVNSATGTHSAVIVPNRPAQVKGNTKGRPAFVIMTDESFGCPSTYGRVLSVEVEATPTMIGAFAVPDNVLDGCLNEAFATEPNGQPRPRRFDHVSQQVHNATVFKNLLFVGWYAQGLRAFDISNPFMPREVGYILSLPLGGPRGYPIFKDGLMYFMDTRNGLHVAKYTGPRADELPGPGAGIYDGNSTNPHR